jgi:butyryl-CoA dehydrogenase
MDFNFSEEQLMLKETLRKIVVEKISPAAMENDLNNVFAKESVDLIGRQGLLGVIIPVEYGGQGLDYLTLSIVVEEISRGDASLGAIIGAHTLGVTGILYFGNEKQKKSYLAGLASGEKLAAFGLTEPSSGSDVAEAKSTGVVKGEDVILNGTKHFITNGGVADIYLVYVYTSKKDRLRGLSCFIVEKGTAGFSFGKHENKMGMRGAQVSEIIFEDCKIPKSNLVGELGNGYTIMLRSVFAGRIVIASQAVGLGQGALDMAISYGKQRIQFGKPVIKHQAIQFMFADMYTELNAARFLTYNAARSLDENKKDWMMKTTAAKLFASEMAHKVVHKALQIHGGYGYMKEFPIERLYRDQRLIEIYEGTSELHRYYLGAQLGK